LVDEPAEDFSDEPFEDFDEELAGEAGDEVSEDLADGPSADFDEPSELLPLSLDSPEDPERA
jgi:hypothetical protein